MPGMSVWLRYLGTSAFLLVTQCVAGQRDAVVIGACGTGIDTLDHWNWLSA
ncbi:MAG: hypothetical protein KGI78_01090 [Patescibacteria group bacterium]|nr:hypothetical protein [Patescibacteria group bacterium]MDE2057431.1 hypothetical protein [Patescibacteria group bacterium]